VESGRSCKGCPSNIGRAGRRAQESAEESAAAGTEVHVGGVRVRSFFFQPPALFVFNFYLFHFLPFSNQVKPEHRKYIPPPGKRIIMIV
jgi:hypothetical protein